MTDDERVRITLALMMMPVTAEHSEAMAVDWARRAAEEADVHMADMMLESERYCQAVRQDRKRIRDTRRAVELYFADFHSSSPYPLACSSHAICLRMADVPPLAV